jgi:hypothetical protein
MHGSVEDTKLSTNKQHSLSRKEERVNGNEEGAGEMTRQMFMPLILGGARGGGGGGGGGVCTYVYICIYM